MALEQRQPTPLGVWIVLALFVLNAVMSVFLYARTGTVIEEIRLNRASGYANRAVACRNAHALLRRWPRGCLSDPHVRHLLTGK